MHTNALQPQYLLAFFMVNATGQLVLDAATQCCDDCMSGHLVLGALILHHSDLCWLCRLLRMTQSVEVLPSLTIAPRLTPCSDGLHRSLLQLDISRAPVSHPAGQAVLTSASPPCCGAAAMHQHDLRLCCSCCDLALPTDAHTL